MKRITDKQRLDWIQRNNADVYPAWEFALRRAGRWCVEWDGPVGKAKITAGRNLRKAVDKAIRGIGTYSTWD